MVRYALHKRHAFLGVKFSSLGQHLLALSETPRRDTPRYDKSVKAPTKSIVASTTLLFNHNERAFSPAVRNDIVPGGKPIPDFGAPGD